jgi:uncharacterized protein involved in type VI secretion and phage assembly
MRPAYRAQALDRRLYGVFSGIVEDNDDPEHEGRVTLRLPWLDDATVTDWCRVVQPYAGDGFGALWVPEKQCEVLVAFVHGDMTEAVVIGGLYNGKDKPATFHQGTQHDVKLWQTRAGHQIRLDDSDQARAIEIKTVAGHDLVLDDQNGKITLRSQLGHHLVLDDRGAQLELSSIGGVGKITIDATGNITVQGTAIKLTGAAITLSAAALSIG